MQGRGNRLTAIMVLINDSVDVARLRSTDVLIDHILALSAHAARSIHPLLELIALPAENVIGVLTVAGVIAVAEVEGL